MQGHSPTEQDLIELFSKSIDRRCSTFAGGHGHGDMTERTHTPNNTVSIILVQMAPRMQSYT